MTQKESKESALIAEQEIRCAHRIPDELLTNTNRQHVESWAQLDISLLSSSTLPAFDRYVTGFQGTPFILPEKNLTDVVFLKIG